jgi:3-phosphoshikimate 1-carboxyvinyltransferase
VSDSILIQPVSRPIHGSIRPPGSKSITNRALIVAALAEGDSELRGVLDSRDTQVMFDSLGRLGIGCSHDPARRVAVIEGCGGRIPAGSADLYLENSGTSIRFLTAAVALGRGEYRLDGNERMRERPIADLVETLNELGGNVTCSPTGCPPVVVRGRGLRGGSARVRGDVSSQFLSGLLMAAPGADGQVELIVEGELVSRPYVDMTLAVMQAFGVVVDSSLVISPAVYRARVYEIEPDASAASYFFAAAAITGGTVTVEGLGRGALQGDVGFVDALSRMGCTVSYRERSITVTGGPLHGIDIDMNHISDTAQTLAVTAVFASSPTRIRNVTHMRHKETDRVAAVVTELRRMGIEAEEAPDGLTVYPGSPRPATIATYDDHRMAMSFALAGLRAPGIRIADPGCTRKTYPGFFEDLATLTSND